MLAKRLHNNKSHIQYQYFATMNRTFKKITRKLISSFAMSGYYLYVVCIWLFTTYELGNALLVSTVSMLCDGPKFSIQSARNGKISASLDL